VTETDIKLRLLEQRVDAHEKLYSEFMLRTSAQLETLLRQSAEWSGIRKVLTVLVGLIGALGGVVGFVVHEVLLRYGAQGGGGGKIP